MGGIARPSGPLAAPALGAGGRGGPMAHAYGVNSTRGMLGNYIICFTTDTTPPCLLLSYFPVLALVIF